MLSICIITLWRETIYQTLNSIFLQEVSSSYEIIIILQWEIDIQRIQRINKNNVPVHVYKFDHGLGFGFYRNKAVEKSSWNILVWIDDDEIPQNNFWLHSITTKIVMWVSHVCTSGCQIKLWQGYLTDCISMLGYPWWGALWFEKVWEVHNWITCHLCSGNFSIDKKLMTEIFFSEQAFFGWEDNALSAQLIKRSIPISYIPEATLIHQPRNFRQFINWSKVRKQSLLSSSKNETYEENIYRKIFRFLKNLFSFDIYMPWKIFLVIFLIFIR